MKNVKIALSIMLSILMAFVFGVDSSKVQASDKDAEIDIEEMFKIQEEACLANEAIYASFDWDKTFVYPDDFAGNYIDYDTLHVQVTSKEAIENYKPLLEGYDCVCYDVVKNSYNELLELAESAVDALPCREAFVEYYVDIKENKAVLCILEKYRSKIKEYLFTDGNLKITFSDEYISEDSSVIAGSYLSIGGYPFTLAGSGTYGSSNAFLCCGHSISSGSSVYHTGGLIGTVSVLQYANYGAGDYSIITASNGYTPTSTVYSSGGTTSYTSSLLSPTVGTILYRYGEVSQQSICQVTDIGIYSNTGTITILGLTKAYIVSGNLPQGGDSGGPYRSGNSFCGIHHGHVKENAHIVYFTPYGYPYYAGFTIKTN